MKQVVDLRPPSAGTSQATQHAEPAPVRRIHQVVNLRATYARVSGDSDQQHDYEQAVEATRRRQRVPFAVAPRMAFVTHDGRRLAPGDEVILSRDFMAKHGEPAWSQMRTLIDRGIVLQRDDAPPPTAA